MVGPAPVPPPAPLLVRHMEAEEETRRQKLEAGRAKVRGSWLGLSPGALRCSRPCTDREGLAGGGGRAGEGPAPGAARGIASARSGSLPRGGAPAGFPSLRGGVGAAFEAALGAGRRQC